MNSQAQTQFIISHLDERLGPFTKDEIVERMNSGELFPIDFAYVEERQDWVTLLELIPDAQAKAPSEPQLEVKLELPPKVAAAPAQLQIAASAPLISSTPSPQGVDGKVSGGVGAIEFTHVKAGSVRIRLKSLDGRSLEMPELLPFTIKPAAAKKIVIKSETKLVAGESASIELEALDDYGNCDTSFSKEITVQLSDSAQGGGVVKFADGKASTSFTSRTAGETNIRLKDHGKTGLDISSEFTIQVVPAAPARYMMTAPSEVIAGQPAKIVVKVVDAFGNHVPDFDGRIAIEVDDSSDGSAATGS